MVPRELKDNTWWVIETQAIPSDITFRTTLKLEIAQWNWYAINLIAAWNYSGSEL